MPTGARRGLSPLVISLLCIIAVLCAAIAVVGWKIMSRDSADPGTSGTATSTAVVTAAETTAPAPAPTATAAPAFSYSTFESPDGSVHCEIGTVMAGTWGGQNDPDVACLVTPFQGSSTPTASCPSNISHLKGAAALKQGSPVLVGLCTGGVPWASQDTAPTLPAGKSSAASGITCTAVTASTISCRNGTGIGFTLSATSLSTTPTA